MKVSALVLVVSMAIAPVSFAQQTADDSLASKEDIERYLDATHSRDMTKKMLEVMQIQMRQMIHQQVSKNPSLPPDFEAQELKRMDDFWKNFPVDQMLRAMIPIYEKHFTKGEIDALVTFYSSPTGQQILAKMPAVAEEAVQASSGIAQKMVAKEMQHVQDDIMQLEKQNGRATRQPD
jgi:uncharacterized protein